MLLLHFVLSPDNMVLASGARKMSDLNMLNTHCCLLHAARCIMDCDTSVSLAATERILQRLQRYSSPKGAPSLQAINAPVPDISPSLLMDKMAAIHLLDSDLSVLSEFTK